MLPFPECFLLLHRAGAKWVPLFAIPGVITGTAASLYMIITGMSGLIAPRRPKLRASRTSTDRVIRWIGSKPQLQ